MDAMEEDKKQGSMKDFRGCHKWAQCRKHCRGNGTMTRNQGPREKMRHKVGLRFHKAAR